MIAFKYTRTDGAEYLSHLDLMRHIMRTLRRAGIELKKSEGYHAHPRLYLNSPAPVGVQSLAEYGTADTDFEGDFEKLFNEYSPQGIKCLACRRVTANPNYANCLTACSYTATGLARFDPALVLGEESIPVTDLRGRQTDIRPKIYSLEFKGDCLCFTLGTGNNNLRADLFCTYLAERFGGRATKILKTASWGEGVF